MKDLIEKLQSAKEGSRELDAWIHWQAQPPSDVQFVTDEVAAWVDQYGGDPSAVIVGRLSLFADYAPHYTTSLDAALMLVPEGWFVQLFGNRGKGSASVQSHFVSKDDERKMEKRGEKVLHFASFHETAWPLALCIAALKARAQ